MKANKENCSSILDYPYIGECYLDMVSHIDSKIRVVEVPKYWREDGKQYKVTSFSGPVPDGKLVIKAPRGCYVSQSGDTTVEYYD